MTECARTDRQPARDAALRWPIDNREAIERMRSIKRCAIAYEESPGEADISYERTRFARGSFASLRMTVT